MLGIVVLFVLPVRIEDARWLTPEEAREARKAVDDDYAKREQTAHISVSQIFTHRYVWALALIFFGISLTNATVNFWLPQMIKQAGLSVLATGFASAIPYLCAVVGLLYWGRRSDRLEERRFHVIAPLVVAVVGVLIAAFGTGAAMAITGLAISATGLFAVLPVFWTLPPQFMVGMAAAGGIAVINSVGNLGGFVGPSIMGYLIDRTGNYSGGFVFDAIMLCVSATTVAILTKSRKV